VVEILVIFLGLLLVSLEIALPGHFFPGITGGILVVFGLVMTFVPAGLGGPSFLPNHTNWPLMEKGIIVVAAAMASSLFMWFWLNRFLPRMPLAQSAHSDGDSGEQVGRDGHKPDGFRPLAAAGGRGKGDFGIAPRRVGGVLRSLHIR